MRSSHLGEPEFFQAIGDHWFPDSELTVRTLAILKLTDVMIFPK
jgi:hypothetical protein